MYILNIHHIIQNIDRYRVHVVNYATCIWMFDRSKHGCCKTPQDPAKKFMVPNFDFCSNHLTLDIRSVILLGHSMTNGNPFALIFFVPDAQNAICPGSVRPLDLFVQGRLPLYFMYEQYTIVCH